MNEKKKYLVTRTETVTVEAKTEQHAEYLAEQLFAYFGDPDTTDMQVEELED